jgi:hypothetical protein
MKHWITALAGAALLLSGVGHAQASIVQLLSASSLNPADSTAIYPGNDGDREPSGVTASAGGNTLTFTDTATVGFLRADQGNTWNPGAFPNGTKLLWDIDSTGSFYGGPVTIAFNSSVHEAGLFVQQDQPDNTTFSVTAFNGATSFGPFNVSVLAGTGNGNLGFLGVQATGSDVITKLVISSVDSVNTTFNNDFAMGPVTFGSGGAAVPEPSTLALAGVCTLGLFVYGRRRQRAAAQLVICCRTDRGGAAPLSG